MNKSQILIGATLFFAMGCATVQKPTAPPEAKPPETRVLERTFGDIRVGDENSLLIEYKDMRLLIDPSPSLSWDVATIDYLLLTEADSDTAATLAMLIRRKNIKIMAPVSSVSALTQAGFTQVKGVSTGQRLYLKKDLGFLFAGAVSHGTKNGYLLEFDNGRNVFVSGSLSSLDPLRQFVFSMRDDGHDVHVGLITARSDQMAAEAVALVQPQFSFYRSRKTPDRKLIDATLAEQLYDGVFSVLKPGQSVSF